MQDTPTYDEIAARYSDADLREARHEMYDTIYSILPLCAFSAGRTMFVECAKAYKAMRHAEREAEANPKTLPARNPVRRGTLNLTGTEDLGGLIDHAHTVAAAVPRTKYGPWVGRVVEQSTATIPPKLIRRLKLAMLDELAGKCDAEYTPLRRVLRRVLEREVCCDTWSLCAGEASLRDVYVHGGVRFTETRVQRTFRALKRRRRRRVPVRRLLVGRVAPGRARRAPLCVCAVSNRPGGVQTVFINGLMYVQPLPSATGLRFPDPWMGGGQRADAVIAGFKEGLCALLLQLLAAHEQCGAWLGVFMMGGKFTRVVVLDNSTVALEVANESQEWLFDDPAWGCTNLPCYAFRCDDMWPVPNRITTVGAFFNSPLAQAPYFPNNLGMGWGVAGALEVNVTNGEDEEENGLQTLLDVFNVAALSVAETKRRPLWMPESTHGHRAAEILEKVAEYRRTGVYTKFYPDEDEDDDSEHERRLALATMVEQIRHTIPRLQPAKRKRAEDSGRPAKRMHADSSLPAKRKREDSNPPANRTREDSIPPAKREHEDSMPPAKRTREDSTGPPAKSTREDSSLPAKRTREDSSLPTKRKRADSPPSKPPGPKPTAIGGDALDIAQWRQTVAASDANLPVPIPISMAATSAPTDAHDAPGRPAAASSHAWVRMGEHPEGIDDPSPEAVLNHLGVVLVLLDRGDMDMVIKQRAAVA